MIPNETGQYGNAICEITFEKVIIDGIIVA